MEEIQWVILPENYCFILLLEGGYKVTLEEILKEIYAQGLQRRVYMILHSAVMSDCDSIIDENMNYSASLAAIKKINKGKNKAIDALCEREGDL